MTTVLKGSILLIEDDRDTRELYRVALAFAGLPVVAVSDGLDALRLLDTQRPALVILDLGLPLLSGRDVYRELRGSADTRDIPILLVTGSDTSDLEVSDFACVLRKPTAPSALVAAVIACLNKGSLKLQ